MFKDSDFDGLDDDMENVEGETVYAATSRVNTAGALVSTARPTVSTAGPSTSAAGTSTGILKDKMVTIADTLIAIRQTRTRPSYLPRPTSVVITDTKQEQRRLTTPPPSQPSHTRDKGKGIMVEPDPLVKIKRSDQGDLQLQSDAELAHYEELQILYEREQKWINDFVPMDSEKEEKKSVEPESEGKKSKRIKRVIDSALKQKSSKKQKMMQEQASAKSDEDAATDYEHEKEELRMWLTVVPDKEDSGSRDFGDLKVMFEPNAEDEIWSNQQDWTLISWKLYENCGVHTLLMDGTLTSFNMLVEKRYPLIKEMLEKWKLEAEAESTMAFELLKFIKGGLLGIIDFYKLVLLVQLDTVGDG
ncbi:hypothetical protein Tco_0511855 [Tanacetum coccineum]